MKEAQLRFEVLRDGPFRVAGAPQAVATSEDHVVVGGRLGENQWGHVRCPAVDRRSTPSGGYAEGLGRRIAIFDRHDSRALRVHEVPKTVNSIIMSPDSRYAMVATGDYDGGSAWSGTIYHLNLQSLELRSVTDENREFGDLRWVAEHTLHAHASPHGDWDTHTTGYRVFSVTVPNDWELDDEFTCIVNDLRPDFPPPWKFDDRVAEAEQELAKLSGHDRIPSGGVTDIHVSDEGTVTACAPGVVAERWDAAGALEWRLPGDTDGGQISVTPERLVAWTFARSTGFTSGRWGLTASRLVTLNPAPSGQVAIDSELAFDPGLLATDRSGNLFNRVASDRETRTRTNRSVFIARDGQMSETAPLSYDLFNTHFVCRDAPDIVIVVLPDEPTRRSTVAGNPPPAHDFARVEPGGAILQKFGVDPTAGERPGTRSDFGIVLRRDRDIFVHSTRDWGRHSPGVVARDYQTGEVWWTADIDAQCSGIALWRDQVVVSTVAGSIAAFDPSDGTIAWQQSIDVDGARCVPISLAACGNWIALGLADGRIARARAQD